jgi:hypothetical protein
MPILKEEHCKDQPMHCYEHLPRISTIREQCSRTSTKMQNKTCKWIIPENKVWPAVKFEVFAVEWITVLS